VAKGLISQAELAVRKREWDEPARATPHAQPHRAETLIVQVPAARWVLAARRCGETRLPAVPIRRRNVSGQFGKCAIGVVPAFGAARYFKNLEPSPATLPLPTT
jgi:hypothetical protein